MSDRPLPAIEYVNVILGVVVVDGGVTLPIVQYFDRDGEDTEDREAAYSCVFGDDEWGYLELGLGPGPTVH